MDFLARPRFTFALLGQMFLLMSLQYMAPNIATHLTDFGFSPALVGASLGCPAILYACICPFIYLLTARIRKRGIIALGYCVVALGMLLIGGSNYLPFVDDKSS